MLDGRTTTAPQRRGQSILDGAAATRSDLPFACKGGVCGTCRAHVAAGEVDLRRNYALDDDELARGYVLTCQGYPVGDAVTVDFERLTRGPLRQGDAGPRKTRRRRWRRRRGPGRRCRADHRAIPLHQG